MKWRQLHRNQRGLHALGDRPHHGHHHRQRRIYLETKTGSVERLAHAAGTAQGLGAGASIWSGRPRAKPSCETEHAGTRVYLVATEDPTRGSPTGSRPYLALWPLSDGSVGPRDESAAADPRRGLRAAARHPIRGASGQLGMSQAALAEAVGFSFRAVYAPDGDHCAPSLPHLG